MERRSRLLAVVCLASVLTLPPQCDVCDGAEPSSSTAGPTNPVATLVVLRDGGVLTGTISTIEGGYLIRRGGAEFQVPAAKVLLACRSLDEAYQARRQEITSPSAEAHLALATWCLSYGLLPHAANELMAVRQLEPNHPRLTLLQRRLADAEVQSTRQPPNNPAPRDSWDVREPSAPAVESTESVSAAVVERFTRRVQPILVNNCTMGGCHQRGGTQQFQLDRALLHGLGNRRTTTYNLAATLALVDRDQPQLSPLLAIPRQTHGGMRAPVFGPRQAAAFNHLVEWVALITRSEPTETAPLPLDKPSNEVVLASNSQEAPLVQNGVEQAADASTPNTLAQPPKMQPKTSVQFGARLQPWRPKDAFDPEIFNRRQRLRSPLEASGVGRQEPGATTHP
jgi:hypothetical protein